MSKLDAQVEKELVAKYDLHFSRLKEVGESMRVVRDFVQYLGTTQYCTDAINKKIFLLNLDVEAAILRLEQLLLQAGSMRDVVKKNVLSKTREARKACKQIPASEVNAFKSSLASLENEVLALNNRALALTDELREEFKKKGF